MTTSALTPVQELIMDTLAARYRTGEHLWTFSSRVEKQADGLADLGLVRLMHGITEHSFRAMLTDEGKSRWLTSSFDPPSPRSFQVMVTVDTDEITDVLAYHRNDYLPKNSLMEKWFALADLASHHDDAAEFDRVVRGMPSGTAWSYLKAREPGGIDELIALLASAGDSKGATSKQ